jgi:hypothetical protein
MEDSGEKVDRIREQVIALLKKGLAGTLTFDELHREWPPSGSDDFYQLVLEDLSSAVEHTPGEFFTGRTDMSAWVGSLEYNQINLDLQLMESALPWSRLLEVRILAGEESFEDPEDVREFLHLTIGQGESGE